MMYSTLDYIYTPANELTILHKIRKSSGSEYNPINNNLVTLELHLTRKREKNYHSQFDEPIFFIQLMETCSFTISFLTQKESCTGEGDIIVCTYQY
jgi:hypothetical protein